MVFVVLKAFQVLKRMFLDGESTKVRIQFKL